MHAGRQAGRQARNSDKQKATENLRSEKQKASMKRNMKKGNRSCCPVHHRSRSRLILSLSPVWKEARGGCSSFPFLPSFVHEFLFLIDEASLHASMSFV
mmetsp:Transcript_41557/g.81970  ORF Transcript_41557/g.81970 Transcript_41557/m.81970 type:complete len:99 (+) Transcript_41557:213-509(+)